MNKPKAFIQTNTLFFSPKELKCMPMDKALMINTVFLQTALYQRIGSVWDHGSRIVNPGNVCCSVSQRYRFGHIFVVNSAALSLGQLERLMMMPMQHNVFRCRHLFLNFLTQSSTLPYGLSIFDFRLQTCAGDAVAQQNVTNLGKVLKPHLWADTHCMLHLLPSYTE